MLTHGENPTADAKDLVDVRDEQGKAVVQEILAAADQGGGFVDYRWKDTDRTAYATPYTSKVSNWPLVVVGGFAQDLSSVPAEVTALPRPKVTAAEVRDRETLRAFVDEAAKTWQEAGADEIANVQRAFRVEGGDWKAGEVYIFVVSTDGYTIYHAGFPLRFEGRQFEDIDREDANGVRYLRELLAGGEAAGASSNTCSTIPQWKATRREGRGRSHTRRGSADPGPRPPSWSHPASTLTTETTVAGSRKLEPPRAPERRLSAASGPFGTWRKLIS